MLLFLGFLAGCRSRLIALGHALCAVLLVNLGSVLLLGFILRLLLISQAAGDSGANGGKERTHISRRRNFAGQETGISFFARQPVHSLGGIIVLTDRCTIQSCASEQSLRARVGEDAGVGLDVGISRNVASDRTGGSGSVSAKLHLIAEQ